MNRETPKKILLVEDEVLIGMAASINLQNYGYHVIHVQNGQKALEVINDKKTKIDLILMDINLNQDMDGIETAKQILKCNDVPIIFLSSHTEREIVEKTEEITSYGYVVKNSTITVLDASIKTAFRLYDAYQKLKGQKNELENKQKKHFFLAQRYSRLFESANDGILILNADNGTILDVNPFLI